MRARTLPVCLLWIALALISMETGSQAQQENHAEDVVASLPASEFSYSPRGRRDPFKPLIEKQDQDVGSRIKKIKPDRPKGPLEKFELAQLRLMAIIVVKGTPTAMVKAPDGKSYTVRVNDYIGMNSGQVKKIETKVVDVDHLGMRIEKSPDRIVVEEKGVDSYSGKEVTENRYVVM